MDPLSMIETALVAGAAAGGKDAASAAVKDAYGELKRLVEAQIRRRPAATAALPEEIRLEPTEDPEMYRALIAEALRESEADHIDALVRAAQELLRVADPAASTGRVFDLRGAVGTQIDGRRNKQIITVHGAMPPR